MPLFNSSRQNDVGNFEESKRQHDFQDCPLLIPAIVKMCIEDMKQPFRVISDRKGYRRERADSLQ